MRLALDTSTLTLSLALVDGANVVEHQLIGPPKRQSEVLPNAVHELLQRHGLTLAQLDGFVCGLGPGSFTGLRIGVATLKGFAWALKKPLAGVGSLDALALEGPSGHELWATAVVRKGELYLGRFRREGEGVTREGPLETLSVADFAARLKSSPALALGPGLDDYGAALLEAGVPKSQLLDAPRVPSAVCLERLAPRLPYDEDALFALEPTYVKGSGAEENPKFPPLPGPPPTARMNPAPEEKK